MPTGYIGSDYLLSASAQQVTRLAEKLALEYAHGKYFAEHLLWAVLQDDVGLQPMLRQIGRDPADLIRLSLGLVEKLPRSGRINTVSIPDERAVAVLKETQKFCLRYGTSEVIPLDILEALLTPGVAFGQDVLRRFPVAVFEILEWRDSYKSLLAGRDSEFSQGSTEPVHFHGALDVSATQILEKYCNDWSAWARKGQIDPIIGRERELKQLMEILGKRLSPNVLIVGESGVGKTAIVGGLALQILEGKGPDSLRSATIFELDVSGRLVAGAFKGEVEERLKSVLKAMRSSSNRIILFIDEIHVLFDERGSVGGGVVNLLKPELSRGDLTVIGATTQADYQKYIERDYSFDRRFTRLVIPEPDEKLAMTMISGLMPRYEEFHGYKVEPVAVDQAVKLAKRYIRDKFLPVSAIELLDLTLACAVQMRANSADILEDIRLKWETRTTEEQGFFLSMIRDRLSELLIGRLGDDISERPIPEVLDTLASLIAEPREAVTEEDVEAMIAYRTGIPIGRLRSKEQDKLRMAGNILRQRVVGQDHVILEVEKALKTFRANLKEPREPGAIFFFTGPTGTGKTELAKAIAELLFDDENALIRFDMSEFQESHSVAALLGSPPGYVGYDEGGLLVNKVRKNPYSVILFDEIEKAHEDIYGIFLQMLTDSRLHDKQGRMADFSNAIIIFTSNAGADRILQLTKAGQRPDPAALKEILRETRHFKDEFLGRVDRQILPFDAISEETARLILDIHLGKFLKLLMTNHEVCLTISDNVRKHLLDIGFSPLFGARPIKNAIRSFLTPPVADKIVSGEIGRGDEVHLDIDDDALVWQVRRLSEAIQSTTPWQPDHFDSRGGPSAEPTSSDEAATSDQLKD